MNVPLTFRFTILFVLHLSSTLLSSQGCFPNTVSHPVNDIETQSRNPLSSASVQQMHPDQDHRSAILQAMLPIDIHLACWVVLALRPPYYAARPNRWICCSVPLVTCVLTHMATSGVIVIEQCRQRPSSIRRCHACWHTSAFSFFTHVNTLNAHERMQKHRGP